MAGGAPLAMGPDRVDRPDVAATAEPILGSDKLGHDGQFSDISFRLAPGEILGLAGLVGSGRSELARTLCGLTPPQHGRVLVDGRPVRIASVSQGRALGIVMLPEDRKRQGLIPQLSVKQNISLSSIERLCGYAGHVRRRAEAALARRYGDLLSIRCSSLEQAISELSGGNQQKVLLARALACEPRVLILDEPTRGVDVAAKADIHGWVRKLAAEGVAIVLISSELEEVAALATRIIVMREGRMVRELPGGDVTAQELVAMAATERDM